MRTINFIAQHLNRKNLQKNIIECEAVCAFTGDKISEGVKLKDITGGTFTDYEFVKYESEFVSINTALCISQSIANEKGKLNSLRNYSFVCTNDELKLLSRDDFMRNVLNPPEPPFIIAYSFNNKKHISYKSVISYSESEFFVCTDTLGNVKFEAEKVEKIYTIIQSWYTKNNTIHKTNESYFNKTEILNSTNNYNKIKEYGFERFEKENSIIEKERNTAFLTIMVRLLNINEVN
jgi:hypothetical protein